MTSDLIGKEVSKYFCFVSMPREDGPGYQYTLMAGLPNTRRIKASAYFEHEATEEERAEVRPQLIQAVMTKLFTNGAS